MQEQECKNKKLIAVACGKVLRHFRKNKSNYLLGMEYGISTSILNLIERGIKDPQLTTIFKLSEALGIKPSRFVKEVEKNLPKDFSLTDD